jgi:NAD(P)-dependent dehydrogenase (short-subunit alcohol dehydrogenase family)
MGLRDLLRPRYDGALVATLGGIVDRIRDRAPALPLTEGDRLDGRTCLVTGANRGLGLAVAIDLVRRGGHVVLACRSGIPEVMDVVRRHATAAASGTSAGTGTSGIGTSGIGTSGIGTVEAVGLDLADLASVEKLVDELAEDGARIDVTVLNAGIVPREARRTKDGFDESFQVNFLANVLLVRRLIERGVIAEGAVDEDDAREVAFVPRIVAVSSESHRSAARIDWSRFGSFRAWGMRDAVAEYGHAKLLLETFVVELARRTSNGAMSDGAIEDARPRDASVHSVCPGAVRTDIGREAPSWVKPALDATMRAFFQEPDQAALPVVYLAAARGLEGRTGVYLHAQRAKPRSDEACDRASGRRIWEESERLLATAGHALGMART